MPRVVASGNAAVAAGSAPASAVTVSSEALSASRTIRPRLRPIRERIQLCGDANSGKTYAYLRLARKKLEDARTNGREPEKFFVVDTDDTMPAFLNEGCEFSDLYYENGGNVYPYPAFSWDEAGATIGTICREAKEGDWVIVDVINRLYDQAQRRVAEQKGIVVTDAAFARGLNHSGFGAFGADEWNLVTLIFNATVGRLLQNGNVNVIFVQHTTEVQPHTRERRDICPVRSAWFEAKGRADNRRCCRHGCVSLGDSPGRTKRTWQARLCKNCTLVHRAQGSRQDDLRE